MVEKHDNKYKRTNATDLFKIIIMYYSVFV